MQSFQSLINFSELSHIVCNWVGYYYGCNPCSWNTLFTWQATEWKAQFTLAVIAPLILFQWRGNVFSVELLLKLKAPMAFVRGPHRAALTVVLASIKGHPFLECKSTMLLMSSLHLPAMLVNICNSTTGNTSRTGQVFKNWNTLHGIKKKKSVCMNYKVICPKWIMFEKIHFEFFFTRVKMVDGKILSVIPSFIINLNSSTNIT